MNLNVLGISVMVLITREWLSNPVIVAEIKKHPLGAAIWAELARIHQRVSGFRKKRMALQTALAELTGAITRSSEVHDRKARALRNLLLFMAEATDDPALARTLRELDALLFPQKLRILHLSYLEKAGLIIELEHRVTPEVMATLESLPLGDQTLADIYRDWVAAGHALGDHAQERARIEASLAVNGSASPQTSARKVRSSWIRGVRLLLDSLDMLELPDTARERLLAPLQKCVRDAAQRRSPNSEPDRDREPAIETDIETELQPHTRPVAGVAAEPDIHTDIHADIQAGVQPDIHAGVHADIQAGVPPGIHAGVLQPGVQGGALPMRAAMSSRPPAASPDSAPASDSG